MAQKPRSGALADSRYTLVRRAFAGILRLRLTDLRRIALSVDNTSPGLNWIGLPLVTTLARLLCRELTLENDYLRAENKILRCKLPKRISFTDDERRSLTEAALAMGRGLMRQVVTIVKPDTILTWQRRLEKLKWDYSERRQRTPGRPRQPANIEQLVCQMA